ncbi:alpha/beta fold hydrolase [Aureivirga sp. CE67]|uniref:alpha/beta fold hydrolase n=1 Tax=Aureivirga sp. CE67 TaxID=1788983 RepID=UPI0018CB6CA3|nr:alpha/beta fold hydrolase [Aureivirga sp. CE67]
MREVLHSKIQGQGEPLLILHGFFGMSDNWKSLGNKYAEQFEVHMIDQRNHGRSFHSEDFTYELMAEDLLHYIQHHNLEKVSLLGHSMGGKTVMLFATMHPEMVDKLIVADISPRFYPVHHDLILEALNSVDFSIHKTRKEVEEVLKDRIDEIGVRQFLLKNVYWKNKGKLAFRFNLDSLTENVDEVGVALPSFHEFEGETLFLRGENSGYISKDDESLIFAHFPKAKIETVKNAGHWLHAENQADFYIYSIEFLTEK